MKKVAVVCNYILKPDRIGGMDRFFKLFDEQLKEKGHHIDWFFTAYTTFDFYENLNIYSANNTSVEQKFLEISKSQNYDVVITHFTELCTKFYKEVNVQNPSSYVVAVDHNPRPLGGYSLNKKLKKRIKSILYSKYIHNFIAVSEYSKTYLTKDFGRLIRNKISIVYNGIDSDKFCLKKDYTYSGSFIVACHLREEKGIQYLLKSLNDIKKENLKNITVDIYGEGPYEFELKRLSENYQLKDIVNFKGSVDNLYEIYNKYDYLIHPSLGETFCYSVVESLLCNVPVITTESSGNVLGLVKDTYNGFLYKEKDSLRLTEIINGIIAKDLAIQSHHFKTIILPDFSLKKMVFEHIKIFDL